MKRININLYGGLGNQIFQLLHPIAKFRGNPSIQYTINTYLLSKYSTKRNFDSQFILEILGLDYTVSDKKPYRLHFYLNRFFNKQFYFSFFYSYFFDSYAQKLGSLSFDRIQKYKSIIADIKLGLNIECALNQLACLHFRLTDFNQTSEQLAFEIEFVKKIIEISPIELVITDDVELFKKIFPELSKSSRVESFSNLQAKQLLLEFTKFKTIVSNGSTLSFWAAVLANSNYFTSNLILQDNFNKLCKS